MKVLLSVIGRSLREVHANRLYDPIQPESWRTGAGLSHSNIRRFDLIFSIRIGSDRGPIQDFKDYINNQELLAYSTHCCQFRISFQCTNTNGDTHAFNTVGTFHAISNYFAAVLDRFKKKDTHS